VMDTAQAVHAAAITSMCVPPFASHRLRRNAFKSVYFMPLTLTFRWTAAPLPSSSTQLNSWSAVVIGAYTVLSPRALVIASGIQN
jgi:hypothetical protein